MIRSPLLDAAGFAHGFSTRTDDEAAVPTVLGIRPDRLFRAKQVHGKRLVVVQREDRAGDIARVDADAIVANEPGDAVLVVSADCVPILVADPDRGTAMAVHAGWRGIEAGVLGEAIDWLAARGSRRDHLVAAIGPHIRVCCFEVGDDVAARLESVGAQIDRSRDEAHADLAAAIRQALLVHEVTRVDDVGGCTKHEADRFHSYRRDGKGAGRQVSAIASGVRPIGHPGAA